MSSTEEFLIFSDLHAHNFPYAAKRVPIEGFEGLFNSRLRDTANVLEDIEQYAIKHDIQQILFAGDLYHRRTSIATDVSNVVISRLRQICDSGIDLFMIPGNHDYGDKFGSVHHLYGLDYESEEHYSDIVVLDKPGPNFSWLKQATGLISVPYTPEIDKARLWLKTAGEIADNIRANGHSAILMAHLGMQGAKVGSDYVLISESDIKTDDVPYDKFDACFFGHFHEHQQLFKNGWFVGATHEHNWGDSGGKRGFLHVKIENGNVSIKRIETSAPKFIQMKEDEEIDVRPQDFVRYITKPGNAAAAQEQLEKFNVEQFEVMEESADEVLDFALDVDKLDPESMLSAWVDATLPDELEKEEVLKEGKRILSKVL